MKLFLLFILSLPIWGQQIVTFTPAQKAAIVGPLNCTFYAQHPNPGQVQIYCTNAGKVVHNSIEDLTIGNAIGFTRIANIGQVTWILSLNTLPNAVINSVSYQIDASLDPDTNTVVGVGIF